MKILIRVIFTSGVRTMRVQAAFIGLLLSVTSAFAQVSLSEVFADCGVRGSITIYNYNEEKWISSDISDSHVPALPASTFKILNTLIALETGVIADENKLVRWPGETDTAKYLYRPAIYHVMGMKEAFRVSAGWVYIELAKKIGKDRYKDYLEKVHYGNDSIFNGDPDFWNYGDFGVTPVDQVEMLVGIYDETLPLSERSLNILKDIMIEEKTEDYILRAKTGWSIDKGKDTGWWVGYVERKNNVYFFATRLIKDRKTDSPDFGKCRKEITRTVLRQLDIIP